MEVKRNYNAVLNRVSKVILDHIGFASLSLVIRPENLHHSFNQSEVKLKPITIRSPMFSRALGSLVDFISVLKALSSPLIGFLRLASAWLLTKGTTDQVSEDYQKGT